MSNQGEPGWFPECLICGMGNLRGAICLNTADGVHDLVPITGSMTGISIVTERDGHTWMRCLLCETEMLADPFAWGSRAYCINCWNRFAGRRIHPPWSAASARRMSVEDWG